MGVVRSVTSVDEGEEVVRMYELLLRDVERVGDVMVEFIS